jgi:hypothetical protein
VFVGEEQWQHVKGSRRAQRAQKVKTAAEELEAKSRELHQKLTEPFGVRVSLVKEGYNSSLIYGCCDGDSSIFVSREWFGDWVATHMKLGSNFSAISNLFFIIAVTSGELKGRSIKRRFVWSRSGEPGDLSRHGNMLKQYGIPAFSNNLYFDIVEGFDKLAPSVLRFGPYGRLPKDLWSDTLANGSLAGMARVYNKTLPTIKKFRSKAVDGEAAHLESLAAQFKASTRAPINEYKGQAVRDAGKAFVCGLARETIEHSNFFGLLNSVTESLPPRRAAVSGEQTVSPRPRAQNRDNCLRRLKRKVKQASEPALAYTLGIFGTKPVPRPVRESLCSRFRQDCKPNSAVLENYRRRAFAPPDSKRIVAFVRGNSAVPAVLLQRVVRRFCSYAEATASNEARASPPSDG